MLHASSKQRIASPVQLPSAPVTAIVIKLFAITTIHRVPPTTRTPKILPASLPVLKET
jgi:hypothetical protein